MRTWTGIEEEASEFERRFSGTPGGVALQTGNHVSFPALVLASLRAGKVVSLFDADIFGEARSRLEARLGVTLRVSARKGELGFDDCAEPDRKEAGTGICLYKLTSGTTALPQTIGFTAEQLVADCDQVCTTMGIRAGDLNYGVIAFTHSYGFSNLVTPLLCRGVPLVAADDPLPRAIEGGLASTRASVFPAVPALFRGLLSADSLPENLRLCISAGAVLDPVLGREFHGKFGRKIHAFYGASECGGICYDGSEEINESHGFVGLPLQGVAVEIPDGTEPAKILIRSLAVASSATNVNGGFQPADLLVRDCGGFRIVGRESDLINVAGRKVNPVEIEQVIALFPGVLESAVCGAEDPARGQEIFALVAARNTPDAVLLRRHCAAHLSSWKVPRRFRFVSEIPRNARGKISRAEIAGANLSEPPGG
ncbi:MAG: fatty acid--CoA ligase family protein [Verrucomicrobiota bacterium]